MSVAGRHIAHATFDIPLLCVCFYSSPAPPVGCFPPPGAVPSVVFGGQTAGPKTLWLGQPGSSGGRSPTLVWSGVNSHSQLYSGTCLRGFRAGRMHSCIACKFSWRVLLSGGVPWLVSPSPYHALCVRARGAHPEDPPLLPSEHCARTRRLHLLAATLLRACVLLHLALAPRYQAALPTQAGVLLTLLHSPTRTCAYACGCCEVSR